MAAAAAAAEPAATPAPPAAAAAAVEEGAGADVPSRLCSQCRTEPHRYRCPRCERRTCSLACLKAHKDQYACNGKRPRSQPVPKKELNEQVLYRDFCFLEEASRAVGTGLRLAKQRRCNPPRITKLQRAARARGMDLKILPSGFERRKQNDSYFVEKTDTILWKMEWVFADVDERLLADRVPETQTIAELLAGFVVPKPGNAALRCRLKPYAAAVAGGSELHVLVKLPGPSGRPQFTELRQCDTLRAALQGHTVLEFPTLYVARQAELELGAYPQQRGPPDAPPAAIPAAIPAVVPAGEQPVPPAGLGS